MANFMIYGRLEQTMMKYSFCCFFFFLNLGLALRNLSPRKFAAKVIGFE